MKYLIVTMFACMMFLYSCSEEDNRTPLIDDPTIPGQVTNVRVEPLPGAVKLTYDLPPGQSLFYVKAECLMKNGTVRTAKATSYLNNLTIEGFSDTLTYTVNLFSVNRSEKESAPIMIQVQPLAPPFQEVFKNIQLVEDWGGVSAIFENPGEADLAICIIHIDNTGFWNNGETFYTKRQRGSVSVRGFQPVETEFGVYIRDRWDNITDTLMKNLTPRFEKELNPSLFRDAKLPSDAKDYAGQPLSNIFFRTANGGPLFQRYFISETDGSWPQWFTVFLGVGEEGALLSRFKFWQRGQRGYNEETAAFHQRNPKKFEIWGSMEPNPDGTWDESWTLLLDEEVIKPSGLPAGQMSDEDWQAMIDGHDFTFPLNIENVRYIRFKVKETFGNLQSIHMEDIAFWGQEPSDVQ